MRPVAKGDTLLYQNNQEKSVPCIVNDVLDTNVVNVSVLFQSGLGYRPGVVLVAPGDVPKYPAGEFVVWPESAVKRERQYPINPDLW